MEYYAHKNDNNEKQSVKSHLDNVAQLSSDFCVDFLKMLAYEIGHAHDIGKYAQTFQERLNGSNVKFEHSSCGAIEYSKLALNKKEKVIAPIIEYCIAGHHTGLPDGGNKNDHIYDDVTLYSRIGRAKNYNGKNDYSAYKKEIDLKIPNADLMLSELIKNNDSQEMIEKYAFFTRYLFSCLTDADFLDTEKFCNCEIKRDLKSDFSSVKKALDEKFEQFKADTPLKQARFRLQLQAYENSKTSGNISILNMPTGSGKTLCSLKIALEKLIASNGSKKRIIYVIPYTSIIEQTAEIFEDLFGQYAEILQHHSNYCIDDEISEPDTIQKLKKATENWNAPFIITTSVRFFESLYHYKGSSLRKLHNLADSIIIFDEIHLLPLNMLQPCLRGVGYITQYLNSEAVFLSATMPDFSKLFQKFLPDCTVTELMSDKADYDYFKKCRYMNLGKTDFDNIIEKADKYSNSLIIVNKKKTAYEVFNKILGKKYHLSTYMTPADRSKTIKAIRKELDAGEKITVVSTSLVEAGVDFDFKAVFRQFAGLDNILQSGGRCNREGKDECGDVYVFETDETLNRELQLPVNIVKDLFNKYDDISSLECIEEYYRRLFDTNTDIIDKNTIYERGLGVDSIPFRTYAQKFEFIKEETIGVVINNCQRTAELIEQLKYGDYSVKRKLQRFTVALRMREFEKAKKSGIINDFGTGVFILSDNNYYSTETGLDLDMSNDIIFG